jgi:hypothetical protein
MAWDLFGNVPVHLSGCIGTVRGPLTLSASGNIPDFAKSVQPFNMKEDFSSEALYELGKKGPYHRFVQVCIQGNVEIDGVRYQIHGNEVVCLEGPYVGARYTIDNDGRLQLLEGHVSKQNPARPLAGREVTPVKSSTSVRIAAATKCSCGGEIEDCDGNQVCKVCCKFYGITQAVTNHAISG